VGNFADLPAVQRQKLGRRGGKSAHASGTAHQWTRKEASAAGRISGENRRKSDDMKKKTKSQKRKVRCSVCRKFGHNVRTCKDG
jgi:hypothetical protein